MSMEVDSPAVVKPKKHRKSEGEALDEKKKKKRKRRTAEGENELALPTKKQRTKLKEDARVQSPPGPTVTSRTSPFYTQTSSLYLPIAPIAQDHPLAALCAEHISPLLLSYYPPFHGILMSYSKPRLSSTPHNNSMSDGRQKAFARSIDEYAATFVWLTAEFLIFRPQREDVIEGFVNLQSENSIGIVYWNFFNASIQRKYLPKAWRWIPGEMSVGGRTESHKTKKAGTGKTESENTINGNEHMDDDLGHWQDGNGKRVDGLLRFYVKDVETSRSADRDNGFLGIEGSMLEPGEDHARPGHERLMNGPIFGGNGT